MESFHTLLSGLTPMLGGYMANPFGNPFFQQQQQMGTRQAANLGQTGMSNITRNLTASGLGGGGSMSPMAMEMMQNQGRANTGLTAQLGFQNPMQNALGMQQWAGGMAGQQRPFQTGQNQTQSTGGLGTWLPQLAQLGMSAATMGMGGGKMGSLGSMFGSQAPGMMAGMGLGPQNPLGELGNSPNMGGLMPPPSMGGGMGGFWPGMGQG